jgi:cell division protein FtsI/penicillin-binding protein 2
MGDEIGFTGIEKAYEDILKGEKGINMSSLFPIKKQLGVIKTGLKIKQQLKVLTLLLQLIRMHK